MPIFRQDPERLDALSLAAEGPGALSLDSPPAEHFGLVIVGERPLLGQVEQRGLAPLTVLEGGAELTDRPALSCDLLVVALLAGAETLQTCLAAWRRLGQPEIVFLTGDGAARPLAEALGCAGVRYLVEEASGARWLVKHAAALAEHARARRWVAETRARLPHPHRPPSTEVEEDRRPAPARLFSAEQSFRTAYLQLLLATSRTRREAAEKAGIPYRTLCHLMEKLGLSMRPVSPGCDGGEGRPPARPASGPGPDRLRDRRGAATTASAGVPARGSRAEPPAGG
jgi:hypothetical protein